MPSDEKATKLVAEDVLAEKAAISSEITPMPGRIMM